MSQNNQKLFSYGTLQLESVQLDTFSRKLDGKKDALTGYRLDLLKIKDPEVIAVSGRDVHNILVPTNNKADEVKGMVFDITYEELLRADAYEVEDYSRIQVQLRSGDLAWVYVKANQNLTL